jgi:hypothetical protein
VLVRVVVSRQGQKLWCSEEATFQNARTTALELACLAKPLEKSGYGTGLHRQVGGSAEGPTS